MPEASYLRSRTQLLSRARQGKPEWQMEYAERLLKEHQDDSEEIKKALLFLRLAANQGHTPALLKLAEYYEQDDKGEMMIDRRQAFHYYLASAKLGNAEARYVLGKRFVAGIKGLACDQEIGVQWLQLAASQQHAKAIYRLAILHHQGQVCGRATCGHVMPLIYLAAEVGHAKAQLKAAIHMMAEQQFDDDDDDGDEAEGASKTKLMEYLMAAAKAGLSEAHLHLGARMLVGKGSSKNPNKAIRHLQLATEMPDNGEADYLLALCYLGGVVVAKDKAQAMEHLKKAIVKGEKRACLILGRLLERSTDKNAYLHSALCYGKLVRHASMKSSALYYLSICYERGKGGVDRDTTLFTEYLRLAAEEGHAQARVRLGQAILLGQSDENAPDPNLGLRYLEEAAERNDPAALAFLCTIYSKTDQFQTVEEFRENYAKLSSYYNQALSLTRTLAQRYRSPSVAVTTTPNN